MTLFKRFLLIDPLFFLSLTIVLYILRMVVPFINYLAIPILFIYFLFTSVHYFLSYKSQNSISLLKFQFPCLVAILFYIIGIIISSHFIFFAFKELLSAFILILLSFSFFLFVRDSETFSKFTWILGKQFILLSSIVSFLGLLKFCLRLNGIDIVFLNFSTQSIGSSLTSDYNFYCLFSFIGLIALIFNASKFSKVFFTLIFILLNSNILLSNSRRGIIMLMISWLFLFLFGLKFKFNLKHIVKKFLLLFSLLCFLLIINNYYFTRQRNQSIDLNSKFQNQVQEMTTQIIFRYLTIIDSKRTYDELYNELWVNKNFLNLKINYNKYKNSKDPKNLLYNIDFKYGLLFWKPNANATKHKIVKTPYGNGVRVSRFNGDNRSWPLLYEGRSIVFYSNHNYIFNFKYKIVSGRDNPFQIGFLIENSDWSDDEGVSLKIISKDLENGWKQGTCNYTFKKTCYRIPFFMNSQMDSTILEFANISLIDSNASTNLPAYADEISSDKEKIVQYINKYDSINRSEMNNKRSTNNLFSNNDFTLGTHFWDPAADSTTNEIIETPFGKGIRVARTNGNGGYWSLMYAGRPIVYYAGHCYRIRFYYKVEKGDSLPFNVGWWVNEANQGYVAHRLPLIINNIIDGWKEATCSYKFKETHYDLPTFLNSLQDYSTVDIANVELEDLDRNDSLPVFVDQVKKINEILSARLSDSIVYRNFKNKLYSGRTNRWLYSMVVFKDSLSIPQKIFGGGFDYLEMFGKEFGEAGYDYPHNPFISAFLYSGIIGGIAYLWFMFLVFFYYIKFYKYHYFYFVCFLVVFYFSFFSGNTHFSIPIYAIFSIIPFLTKYLVEKEKNEAIMKQIDINI